MTKKISQVLFNLSFVFATNAVFALSTPITTCAELMSMSNNLAGNYVLANSIDCSGANFVSIGTSSAPFTGNLDGAGNTISNLSAALFGYTNKAMIFRVNLDNSQIKNTDVTQYHVGTLANVALATTIKSVSSSGSIEGATRTVGGLVGLLSDNSTISDSMAAVSILAYSPPEGSIGGLVGRQWNANIIHSFATGAVSGFSNVGGMTGSLEGGSISLSAATGPVSSSASGGKNVGGLVGNIGPLNSSHIRTEISNSYATGNVTASAHHVGGLIGFMDAGISPDIQNTFASGDVSGETAGGLIGGNAAVRLHVYTSYASGKVQGSRGLIGANTAQGDYSIVYRSYWDIEKAGGTSSKEGTGKTTAEMYQKNTYEGWDFSNTWKIDEGKGYPQLSNIKNLVSTIKNCAELQAINKSLQASYVLLSDIDCSGISFMPIGSQSTPFTGMFDGKGHTISNVTIPLGKQKEAGLFGVTKLASITHLHLKNVNISGNGSVGALIGYADATSISSVISNGKIIANNTSRVGGLIGYLKKNSLIANSHSSAHVEGLDALSVGGLVGYAESDVERSQILNSYSEGSLWGRMSVGGLVGHAGQQIAITHSYAKNTLLSTCSTASHDCVVGGLVGNKAQENIIHSYYDADIAGFTNSLVGEGKTTAELLQKNTYHLWDFNEIWSVESGVSSPRLKIEMSINKHD